MSKITKTLLGKIGEDKAVEFLQNKSYQIVVRNFRFRKAEIDIVALYGNVLIFIEVKSRKNNDFGFPEDFVDMKKRKLVISAARHYIEIIDWQKDIRFDIISITGNDIEHFIDAFY